MTIVLVGVFSGLGFAAFENITYAVRAIGRSAALTLDRGASGFVQGVSDAMVSVMFRSMSLVFLHAVASGILAYFIALGFVSGKRRIALFLVGLLVAASLHGIYNWAWTIQSTLPAVVVTVGFTLFYAYLTKLRLLLASDAVSRLDLQERPIAAPST